MTTGPRDVETEYRAIWEASSDGLVINDAETGLVIDANPAFCRMHGYSSMVGFDPTTFIHESSHHLLRQFFENVSAGREFRAEALDVRRDGTTFDVEVLGRGLIYQGKFTILGVVRDITDRVRAYQLLEQRVAERTREIAARQHELETLYHADAALHRSLRLEEVLQALVDVAADMLGTQKTSVLVWDQQRSSLALRAAHGFNAETIAGFVTVPEDSVSARVARSGEPLAVADLLANPRLPAERRALIEQEGLRALISVPITTGSEVVGVFNVHAAEPREFSADEQRLLVAFAQRAALAIGNAQLFAQTERQRREMEALYRADEVLHRSLQLDDVLAALVEVVVDILGADKASVLVWDAEHRWLLPGPSRGYGPDTLTGLRIAPNEGVAGRVGVTGETMMVDDAGADPRTSARIDAITAAEAVRSFVSVPIIVREEVFGVFNVNYSQAQTFTEADQRVLEALARRASIAVQNAELYERAQAGAVLEERQRLARELHDAVTQTLFSASLIGEVLPALVERRPAEAARRAEELRRLTRGALAEMRTLLVELRPGALSDMALADLLRQLVEAAMSRVAVSVEFQVDGQATVLPARVQLALYRLAQEALNNIVRHAAASHARVTLHFTATGVELDIRDDGVGFDPDPAAAPAGHFGLRIMRERSEGVGAVLTVDSHPGGGTRVHVRWQAPATTREADDASAIRASA